MIAVASVPGFAQSDSVPRANTEMLASVRGPTVMSLSDTSRPTDLPRVALPPNFTFPESYREIIESMLARSPTFRRQCLRLANASDVTVRVQTLNPYAPGISRARSYITRGPGERLAAVVEIRPLGNLAELIAHEIEHVIEQLDGIDLKAQSSMSNSGVRTCPDGSFETIRAIRVGQRVARDVRAGR
jgi:hypothetical protein